MTCKPHTLIQSLPHDIDNLIIKYSFFNGKKFTVTQSALSKYPALKRTPCVENVLGFAMT